MFQKSNTYWKNKCFDFEYQIDIVHVIEHYYHARILYRWPFRNSAIRSVAMAKSTLLSREKRFPEMKKSANLCMQYIPNSLHSLGPFCSRCCSESKYVAVRDICNTYYMCVCMYAWDKWGTEVVPSHMLYIILL